MKWKFKTMVYFCASRLYNESCAPKTELMVLIRPLKLMADLIEKDVPAYW